jgi:flagellar biosynthesis GTPase FlhF
VSTLDFNNAVLLQGFRIPALSTRRTETELELQDGQTFAIAGLLNNTLSSTLQKIPGIGDIPILGALFRSKAAQKEQSELVVMITPQILRTDSPGVTPSLPKMPENFLPPVSDKQAKPTPAPAFRGAELATPGAVVASASPKNVPVPITTPSTAMPSPAAAAAAVSALTPAAPKMATTPSAPGASATASVQAPAVQTGLAAMSEKDQKALEGRVRAEQEQAKKIQRAEAKQAARQAKIDAENERKEAKAREKQARIDAELAKRKAAADAKAAKQRAEEEKRAAEAAKKQAAVDQERTKSLEAAAARLKEAQAAYNAELARQNDQPAASPAGTR